MEIYIFDGSFEGLLTAVFEYYERKAKQVKLVSDSKYQPSLLSLDLKVHTDKIKAARVWTGLQKKWDKDWTRKFYSSWLSEDENTFNNLFNMAIYIFNEPQGACNNFGNPFVLAVGQIYHKVHREKHRMEAFIRFQQTKDGIYYAAVEPDFNVLPLIAKHFKNRYADQSWIIYDQKRKYGLSYDQEKVTEITFEFEIEESTITNSLPANVLDTDEELYSILWKDYFKSTNIPARKNMALHVRHVPKRYWRFLTEKWTD